MAIVAGLKINTNKYIYILYYAVGVIYIIYSIIEIVYYNDNVIIILLQGCREAYLISRCGLFVRRVFKYCFNWRFNGTGKMCSKISPAAEN